tara:strand:+ start:9955 stop:10890 length:936 start_codon:yes stop_codon:yes gene_type:complete
MIIRNYLNIFILIFFFSINVNSLKAEIFIKAKVNNQIITNLDIQDEKNYLIALNPKLKDLSKDEIFRYSIDSIINERIKKIEIEKNFEIIENENVIDKIIKNLYLNLNINNLENFKLYLKNFNVNISQVRKKITIEVAWNDLIVKKFNNSIFVDTDKIKKKIDDQDSSNFVRNLSLSEIIFTIKDDESFSEKYDKIKSSITSIGFNETARIYSLADSKNDGGNIGWVYRKQLSDKIIKEVDKLSIGEFSKPITTSGGFILIKLNDFKDENIKVNKEELFSKAIDFEKNRQLNRYSTIFYKRIYNSAIINEF